MYRLSKGFTVTLVLLMLYLTSLLALYQLSFTASNMHLMKEMKNHSEMVIFSKHILRNIEKKFIQGDNRCLMKELTPLFLKNADVAFWKKNGCLLESNRGTFYYLIEDLGEDNCAYITDSEKNQQQTPRFYRISLFLSGEKLIDEFRESKIIFESTLAKPVPLSLSCVSHLKPHEVYMGEQMRRELIS